MNRLQKKCVIATAGFHLLLLVILFVGPAFFNAKPKDDSQVLDVIPANLVDAALNSGVKGATPPPLAPPVTPQPPTPPVPPPPVQPPPTPEPTFAEQVKKFFTPQPPPKLTPLTPVEKQPPTSKINLVPVTRNVPKTPVTVKPKDNSQAIKSTLQSLRNQLSSATTVDMPGNSSVAYANYGTVVVSVYYQTWPTVAPNGMDNDNAMVKFSVTIARDGTVISSRIVNKSGDANVDAAVRRMLDRVTFIAPFPEGATENQRTYPINFNATRTTE